MRPNSLRITPLFRGITLPEAWLRAAWLWTAAGVVLISIDGTALPTAAAPQAPNHFIAAGPAWPLHAESHDAFSASENALRQVQHQDGPPLFGTRMLDTQASGPTRLPAEIRTQRAGQLPKRITPKPRAPQSDIREQPPAAPSPLLLPKAEPLPALPELPGGPHLLTPSADDHEAVHRPAPRVDDVYSINDRSVSKELLPWRRDPYVGQVAPKREAAANVTAAPPRIMYGPVMEPARLARPTKEQAASRAPLPAPRGPQLAPRSPLPAPRTPDPIARRAEQHVREAFALAERGAMFSAKTELIQALRLVTQAGDAREQTNRRSQALAAGLRALEEAEDFIPTGTQLEADLDLPSIIISHRTPVLNKRDADQPLLPMVAVQQYLLYAQQQLTVACEDAPAGSLALYGLGRMHVAMAEASPVGGNRRHPQAMTLYHAALAADANNYMAANELGVLLARYGRLDAAKQALQLAVRANPQPESWRNLAVVHRRLGEHRLAEQAHLELAALSSRPRTASHAAAPRSPVEWVAPEAFVGGGPVATQASTNEPRAAAAPREDKPEPNRTSWLPQWLNDLR